MQGSQIKQLKNVPQELDPYKKILAELTLSKIILKGVFEKSSGPTEKRELVGYAREIFLMNLRQDCILFYASISVFYYQVKSKDDEEIIGQLSNLADLYRTWGFWMMYHRLLKLRYLWNYKGMYRVYSSMDLNLHNKGEGEFQHELKRFYYDLFSQM